MEFEKLISERHSVRSFKNEHLSHDVIKKILDAGHRCEMIKLAIEGKDYLQFSDFELKREGVIYTAMTLQQLCEENPDTQYTFIMGADSFLSLTNWYHPDRILRYAGIAVCNRNNVRERVLFTQRTCLLKTFGGNIDILNFEGINISSHYIRNVIKESQSDSESINKIKKYINPKVLDYIKREGLYI